MRRFDMNCRPALAIALVVVLVSCTSSIRMSFSSEDEHMFRTAVDRHFADLTNQGFQISPVSREYTRQLGDTSWSSARDWMTVVGSGLRCFAPRTEVGKPCR
jgi:hypothetical protein